MSHHTFPAPSDLIPHEVPMVLVDQILACDETKIVTQTRINEDNPFYVLGRGLPAYVTFEMMAQSISAQDGETLKRQGKPPAVGLLLGCRKFSVSQDWIKAGETVITHVEPLLFEGELRSFQCQTNTSSGEEIACGSINVFRPENPEAFKEQLLSDYADRL
jgi:predicted hotdog family 3-hydroxylacyl-ACP dehydratase